MIILLFLTPSICVYVETELCKKRVIYLLKGDIPDYLIDATPTTSTSSANDTEPVNKLYAALKKKEEENDCHKNNVLALPTKHRKMIADLQEKHETISHLNSEFTKYEQSMKSYGESESKLKQLIKTQQQEMKDQEDKFNQAGRQPGL